MPLLEWTDNAAANRLISQNPLALLIGFVLDQQVPLEKAFIGPELIRQRLGTLDCKRLAKIDPASFETAFVQKPAIHRYPTVMAQRVQTLCDTIFEEYRGKAETLWTEAKTAEELQKRLGKLPGFGHMKVRSLSAVLVKQFGIKPTGWKTLIPDHPSLADVSTAEQRRKYQAQKREYKAKLRAGES